jgi:Protein of unknown function (DUF2523)
MPVFIAAFLGGLYAALGTLIGRVLISLGIGYVTFQGVDVGLTVLRDQALARLGDVSSLGATAAQLAGVLQIGTCVNMLFSAWSARLVVSGLTNGTITKMVQK